MGGGSAGRGRLASGNGGPGGKRGPEGKGTGGRANEGRTRERDRHRRRRPHTSELGETEGPRGALRTNSQPRDTPSLAGGRGGGD